MSTAYLIQTGVNEKARYEEYEELLVRRDQLFKEAGSLMTEYTAEFGDLITANFELKVECIKKKKTISYCRRRINRGLSIDTSRMQEEIDREMTLYYDKLKGMQEDSERAKKAKTVSEFRLSMAKKIYRRLAKLIQHPSYQYLQVFQLIHIAKMICFSDPHPQFLEFLILGSFFVNIGMYQFCKPSIYLLSPA